MDCPGVSQARPDVLARITPAAGPPIDGHAPALSGRALDAYLVAGPHSDHESTTLEEGREKLRRGMYLMIREGTTEKNLAALLPLVDDRTASRAHLLVCDDLRSLQARQVYIDGRLVAEDGQALFAAPAEVDPRLTHSFNVGSLSRDSFALPAVGTRYPVIEAIPGQILTGRRIEEVPVEGGRLLPDPARGLLHVA